MSFFLRHLAGFLIQIGGGMVLCLLPFQKNDFRYPRKWVFTGYSILALAFSLGFPWVMNLAALQSIPWRSMASNLYMLTAVLIMTALYLWIIQTRLIKKMLVLVLVLFYSATQYLLVNLTSPLFPGGVLPDVYPPLTLMLYGITAAVLFPLTAVLMIHTVRPYLAEIEPGNIRREFAILLAATVLYFLLLLVYASRPDGLLADYWWWIVPPLLLTVMVLGLFYWTLFRESVRRKRDNDWRRAMEIQNLQYESITREMEQTRRIRHDMRHTLNRLADMLEQNQTEEMKEYLSTLTVQVAHRDRANYCKNDTVNALLRYYAGLAADKGIPCQIQADCKELTIAPVDLTVLLGNTLENAIRSCEDLEERWIKVQIGVIGGTLAIQVANACQGIHPSGKYRVDGSFLPASAFVSSRAGGGYGLSSLEHTAKKYGGNAAFGYDEHTKTFTTRIRLNLHPDML